MSTSLPMLSILAAISHHSRSAGRGTRISQRVMPERGGGGGGFEQQGGGSTWTGKSLCGSHAAPKVRGQRREASSCRIAIGNQGCAGSGIGAAGMTQQEKRTLEWGTGSFQLSTTPLTTTLIQAIGLFHRLFYKFMVLEVIISFL